MLPVFVLAFLVAQLSALASPSTPPFTLFSRQASGLSPSDIPAACQVTCAPIETTINSCQQLSCLCNNNVAKQIADCADCFVAASGDSSGSLLSQEQSLIDQYTNACDTSGETVSSIKVSSVVPSGSAAASGSAASALPSVVSSITFISGSGTATAAAASSTATASSSSGATRDGASAAAVLAGFALLLGSTL